MVRSASALLVAGLLTLPACSRVILEDRSEVDSSSAGPAGAGGGESSTGTDGTGGHGASVSGGGTTTSGSGGAAATGSGGGPPLHESVCVPRGDSLFVDHSIDTPELVSLTPGRSDGDGVHLVFVGVDEDGQGADYPIRFHQTPAARLRWMDGAWDDVTLIEDGYIRPRRAAFPIAIAGSRMASIAVFEQAAAHFDPWLRIRATHPGDFASVPLPNVFDGAFALGFLGRDTLAVDHGAPGAPSFTRIVRFSNEVETSSAITGLDVCSDRRTPIAFAPLEGTTLVAAGVDPDAVCEDGDAGPPIALRMGVLDEGGVWTGSGLLDVGAVVEDVMLAPRPGGGAWLGAQHGSSATVRIASVAADGAAALVVDVETRGRAGIAPWREGFAVVDRAADDVALRLRLYTATGELVDEGAIRTAAARPEARPAVIASPDGASVAVATFDRLSDDVLGTDSARVVLTRADCAL